MRSVDGATSDYLQARAGLVARDFLWLEGRNRTTGATEAVGFWSDLDTVTVTVVSGQTGLQVARDYTGSGSLIAIDPIPLTADLTIPQVRIRLSPIDEAVEIAIRGYEPRQAVVEIHRGLFDLDTRALVAPPLPHFVGRVEKAPIATPAVGGEGGVELTVVGHINELTRTNPAKKSDESQRRRADDRFYRYASVVKNWPIYWGEEKARPAPGPGGIPDGLGLNLPR